MYSPASIGVTNSRPPASGIGFSNLRLHPLSGANPSCQTRFGPPLAGAAACRRLRRCTSDTARRRHRMDRRARSPMGGPIILADPAAVLAQRACHAAARGFQFRGIRSPRSKRRLLLSVHAVGRATSESRPRCALTRRSPRARSKFRPRLFDVDIAGVDEPAFNLSVGVAATGTKQEKEIAYGLFDGRPARG